MNLSICGNILRRLCFAAKIELKEEMGKNMLYPLKFYKVFKEKVWGGRALGEKLGMELPDEKKYGESWEVTCHKNGMSMVSEGELEGRSLEALIEEYREELVGDKVYKEFGDKFPLLIKYLDINDKLSVQVHPHNSYKRLEEGELGKSEVWYIMEATADAQLILGVKGGISKEEFGEKAKKKEFDRLFNVVDVKKGDFINVEPGLAHASLRGSIVICEIQQNSDTTYRIYDFDRLVDGELRPLHIDKAVEVLSFGKKPDIIEAGKARVEEVGDAKIEKLIRNEYFAVERICIDGEYEDKVEESFKILSILDGEGEISYKGKNYEIIKGDTYFIPACLDKIKISGNIELLKSYV